MAVGDRVTRPGHIQYGTFLFGPGTPYQWEDLTGWDDLPDLDSGTVLRPAAHGAYPGDLLAQTRVIGLNGLIIRAPLKEIGAAAGALTSATGPAAGELPLVAWLDDRGPLLVLARVVRRAVPTNGYRVGLSVGGAIEWEATDPRRYDLIEQVATATLPAPERGLVWDTAPAQVLDEDQAAGVGALWRWWTDGDPVLTGDGVGAVTIHPQTAGGELVWTAADSTYGWPVSVGAEVAFTSALAAELGATIVLRWWDASDTYLADATGPAGAERFTATAPAGAAWVQPVVLLPDALPDPVPIGASSLLISVAAGSLTWPLDFGTPGSTGNVSVINGGDAATHPVVEFRGPVERPSLTNVATGDVLEYDMPLAEGDVLTIDTAAGTVTLNATASRLYTVTSRSVPEQSWTLPPGPAQLQFRAAAGDPTASVTVRHRAAYW